MSAFDITIYGHLSFDNIYNVATHKTTTSVGCMGNVWKQLKLIDPKLKIRLAPTDIGESLILSDSHQSKRTSVSLLSLNTVAPEIQQSKISHVMYLNELKDSSYIAGIPGFITADVCNGKPLNVNDPALKYISLLFISDEDVVDIDELVKNVKGSVILHHPAGSTLFTKTTSTHFTAEVVNSVNVLGAGDKFAAYVLHGILEYGDYYSKVIQTAHDKLSEYFKNEKIQSSGTTCR